MSLMSAMLLGVPLASLPVNAMAEASVVQQNGVVKGIVKSATGEPLMGAVVFVVGTKTNALTDDNGAFTLKGVKDGATIRISLIGYNKKEVKWTGGDLNVELEEMGNGLNEVVVTAMGIVRKEKSLTYATQQIKADDFMKVQDANLVNSIEGKVSGVTITPSAGGAGGASKILLRGNKSIFGNNDPLIVVDGIPMSNGTRNKINESQGFEAESRVEGGDALSQINPDDIESMNILKGANAAALYGSQAANGVIMITTKKGKEGRLSVNFTSNVNFDTPLTKPELQGRYGASVEGDVPTYVSWGEALGGHNGENYVVMDGDRKIYMRDRAQDDLDDFYRLGVTTNNSLSLAGGTDKLRTYVSYANTHANGMIRSNSYNRNTFAFRQSYKFFDRVNIDVSANYVQTVSKNRVGGGTLFNPIYHMLTVPCNVDMDYYRHNYMNPDGHWKSNKETGFVYENGHYIKTERVYDLHGVQQDWAFNSPMQNNPYWLMNMNTGEQKEDRFYGSAQGKVDIYDGLSFQARVSVDFSRFQNESHRYATTWLPSTMDPYGNYWLSSDRRNELYTDYLLMYNKTFGDYSVSATAGWVGHRVKGESTSHENDGTIHSAELWSPHKEIPVNLFQARGGMQSITNHGRSSSWDKAALFTAQFGWKDMVYVDGSYRRDWYRPFKQFAYRGTPDNYGYFGFGANAILSSLLHLPKWISYAKYRLSYSEVGNSIPNMFFNQGSVNRGTGTITVSPYNSFDATPEKTKSFETGFETQFLDNSLNFDITYYNSSMHNSYLIIPATNGKQQPVNTGVIRNQGVEVTLGYNWQFAHDWHWKTSVNFSYNKNKIEKTYRDENGVPKVIDQKLAGVQIRFEEGGSYGDMYVTDYRRWANDVYKDQFGEIHATTTDADGNPLKHVSGVDLEMTLLHKAGDIYLDDKGMPSIDGGTMKLVGSEGDGYFAKYYRGNKYTKFLGNMNSNIQLGWSNTISWKDFSLFFLINGRIGGKVISMTEGYLDKYGVSKRTADARAYAEANNIYWVNPEDPEEKLLGVVVPGGVDQIAPIQSYYETVGTYDKERYVYNATNFRLRELSLGYTFRNLFGESKNLSLSFVGRNLFFIYKDAPVDPDVSLSSGNGLGGFELFNLPSARSFGINLKLNF